VLTSEICPDPVGRPGLDPGTLGLMMTTILSRRNANSCANPSDLVFASVAHRSLLSATSRPLRAHNPNESIHVLPVPVRHHGDSRLSTRRILVETV
jgi:hypothetical protein